MHVPDILGLRDFLWLDLLGRPVFNARSDMSSEHVLEHRAALCTGISTRLRAHVSVAKVRLTGAGAW